MLPEKMQRDAALLHARLLHLRKLGENPEFERIQKMFDAELARAQNEHEDAGKTAHERAEWLQLLKSMRRFAAWREAEIAHCKENLARLGAIE